MSALANNTPSKAMKFRTKAVMTASFSLLFAAVTANFFNISVLNNRKYQEMANAQHFGSITISAHRGSIYDAKGTALAKSASVYKVFLDPQRFREDMETLQKRIDKRNEDKRTGAYEPVYDENGVEQDQLPESAAAFREEAVQLLASRLNIKPEKVSAAMEENSQYSVLQDQVEKPVSDELLGFFSQYGLTCLNVEEDTKRYYPQDDLAASVIGFTAGDGYGAYGIEAYYDDYLAGTDGRTISATDSHGNELPYRYSKTYPAKNGNDVYLTIDMNIQYILEKYLQEMVTTFEVKNRACSILMDAKTGAIYGMATCPSFDLNDPYTIADPVLLQQLSELQATPGTSTEALDEAKAEARELQWKNKCITEVYEPGSVFKVVTSASAIEENLIDLDHDSFVCYGQVELPGALAPIKCHDTGGHGAQTFQQALTNSCNPAFIEIGRRLGVEKFCYYFDAFGLRERTGIDLPAESAGIEYTADEMTNVDLAVSAFGQGETITPIEMINSYCAAINGGYLLQPYVVDKIVDEDGNVVLKNERTVKRQVVSEETSAKMRDALEKVVSGNGGGNVTIKGYSIGGKSGTSQRLSITAQGLIMEKDQEEDADAQEYAASYVCFAPADDPQIILLVMADMPNKNIGYYGSKVAVPTARDILTDVLPYMGINPEYSDEELANLDVKVPLLQGSINDAKATLDGLGVKYNIVGEGPNIIAQSPLTGSSMSKDGTVWLFTEADYASSDDYLREVPDLVGLSATYANESIVYSELNYVARGASVTREDAVVNSQSIPPGSKVAKGTTIELEFIVNSNQD
ncbi:MAG TPA: penicillin-binding transpeptidase domain-containing protein [Ruminococcus sp.]|nr:penicillin-binding transpeptidase domain-containing protein [Ruminococcus sp.]